VLFCVQNILARHEPRSDQEALEVRNDLRRRSLRRLGRDHVLLEKARAKEIQFVEKVGGAEDVREQPSGRVLGFVVDTFFEV
jgi:hypothetical protein